MIQGSKTTDLGTVNGTLLSWQEMSQLMEPQNEHTHTHTCTHTHIHPNTPKTTSQIRTNLVPPRRFAQLPLLGPHKPDQAEESGTQPSFWVSRGLSPVEAEGVPVVGEDGDCATFYSILTLL